MVKALKNILLRYPLLCLLTGLILMGTLLPHARNLHVAFGPTSWFEDHSPELVFLDEYKKSFGVDETFVVAVESPNGIFNQKTFHILDELTDKLWLVTDIIRVDTLSNYNLVETHEDDIIIEPVYLPEDPPDYDALKKKVMGHEDLPGYMVSKDETTTFLYASIRPVFDGIPDYIKIRKEIRKDLEELEKKYPDYHFHILGSGALNAALKDVSFSDLRVLFPLFIAFLLIVFFLFFKNVAGVMMPLAIVLFTNLTTLGLAGLFDIKVVTITFVIPIILMAIGIADSIHILEYFFNNYHSSGDRRDALEKTLDKNLWPTFLTSVTTMIGFFSLMTADLVPIREMGMICGIGVMFAWFFSFVIIVPYCLYIPIKKRDIHNRDDFRIKTADWFLTFIVNNRNKIIIFFGALTILMIALGLTNRINSNPYQNFAEHLPVRKANDFFLNKIGGLNGPQILIDSEQEDGIYQPEFLKKVDALQTWLNSMDEINNVSSILNVLKQTNRALNGGGDDQYKIPSSSKAVAEQVFLYGLSVPEGKSLNNLVTMDKRKLRMSILWTIQDSVSGTHEMELILNKARELGLNATITGKVALTQMMVGKVIKIFIVSLATSVTLICLIFFVLFKDVKIGLISLLPNILPIAFTSGVLVLIGQDIDFTIAISSCICLGIAVDDTIHFIGHYIRLKDKPTEEALSEIFRSTGSGLVLTTIVLVAGFGIFLFADFIPNRNFGILTASSLFIALVADLLLLPALFLLKKTRV